MDQIFHLLWLGVFFLDKSSPDPPTQNLAKKENARMARPSKKSGKFRNKLKLSSDMEIGADTRTLSAEIFENCGKFWLVDDYLLIL